MANNYQIDRVSKLYCKLDRKEKREAKREHSRSKRRFAKNIDNPHPQYNRYNGYIG